MHLRPGLELHPAAHIVSGMHACNESRNDARSPFEHIRAGQGVDECALARFNRANDGDAQERILEGGLNLRQVYVPPSRDSLLDEPRLLQLPYGALENLDPLLKLFLELKISVHDPPP